MPPDVRPQTSRSRLSEYVRLIAGIGLFALGVLGLTTGISLSGGNPEALAHNLRIFAGIELIVIAGLAYFRPRENTK